MYLFLKQFHSIIAFIVVFSVFSSIVVSLIKKNKLYLKRDKLLYALAMSGVHLQFILGIFLYIEGGRFDELFDIDNIKNAPMRFLVLEHPLIMLIVVGLITVGYSKHKKAPTDALKFKNIYIFYTIAFILMLSRINFKSWLA